MTHSSQKKYTPKRFLIAFALASTVVLFLIGLVSYIVDPFFQFRVNPDNQYILNPRFVNGGLAKNYDYNAAVIGSSMVQNYNMAILRDNDPNIKPVKLSTGGMNINEMEYMYSFVDKDKAKDIIINIDMPPFNSPTKKISYPKHLYDNGILNKLEYLYGYETCMQYIPADLGMMFYYKTKGKENIPTEFKMKTNIDAIGDDSYNMQYGADYVKRLYLGGTSVSYMNLEDMKPRMEQRLDSMLARINIEKYKDINYTFIFPCYSALYWYHARKQGYYDQFMDFIRYFNQSVEKYDNVEIAFFLDRNEITDLNFYRDITHFGPTLSDTILNNVFCPQLRLNSSNIDIRIHKVDSLVDSFIENNKDWLPQ